MRPQRFITSLLLVAAVLVRIPASRASTLGDPEILSFFPMGGQRGSVVEVEVRGKDVGGCYGAWFTGQDLAGEVKASAIAKLPEGKKVDKKAPVEYEVSLQITVAPSAALGPHPLRLVSPQGVSNAVLFHVYDEPAITELPTPHPVPHEAQEITFPLVVNGRIGAAGEVDVYEVAMPQAKELTFELTISHQSAASRFRPQLALYQIQGSWFDASRPVRLAFTDQIQGDAVVINTDPREKSGTRLNLRYQASKAGRYYLEVGSLFGRGAEDQIYQLRVVPTERAIRALDNETDWRERVFTRKLEPDWLRTLWARAVEPKRGVELTHASAVQPAEGTSDPIAVPATKLFVATRTDFDVLTETEPNAEYDEAQEIAIPALLEGSIDRSNDIDTYKFKVSRGQRLAFEIETPKTTSPQFNPLLSVLDPKEVEVLSNLQRAPEYKSITTPFLKSLNAKVIGTFEQEGEYYLRIQDITSRKGDPGFYYRVLVRPQIAHLGEIELETRTRGLEDGKQDPSRLNLVVGEARKVTLITDHEEGFFSPSNMVSIHPEGLPEGVEAFAAASSYSIESRVKEGAVFKEESFLPKKQNITIVFQARADAPITRMPVNIRFFAQPIVDGKVGLRLPIKNIPLMVVKPPEGVVAHAPADNSLKK